MDRVLGQSRAIEAIRKAFASDRIHHAWIFSGPFGVGKFTTAVEFARLLLDPDAGPDLMGRYAADPGSATSHLIDAGSHPDLHVIRKELALYSSVADIRRQKLTNIPLDIIREHMVGGTTRDGKYHEPLAFHTPARGHGKVFIIDEADLLDAEGQNAMLKTLEEPSRRTVIVLITSRPDRLLPTIHSRCQHIRFGALDEASMATWVAGAHPDLDADAGPWIMRFADGSPGRAQIAIEYEFAGWFARVSPLLREAEAGTFPVAFGETMASFIDEFATSWVKRHDQASKDAANKDGARHLFAMLSSHARAGMRSMVESGADPERFLALVECIRDAESQIASNVNQKLVLENLAAQWSTPLAV